MVRIPSGTAAARLARAAVLAFALASLASAPPARADAGREAMVERAVAAFADQDHSTPPAPGGVVFAGSSSIERWDLPRWFPGLAAINRGIGGSHISDLNAHLDALVLRYRPRIVVIYAGDNDLADGGSATQVAADFRTIVAQVHASLPATRIVYIPVKPSLARWNLIDSIREANERVRAICAGDPLLAYVDVVRPMIGPDGKPRPELFAADGLHLSPAGYRLWTSLVMPLVEPDPGQPAAGARANQP